jgi:cytochrome bd-type quinol oxidase subunit 1
VEYDEGLGLRTVDAASPSVDAAQVVGSILGFGLVYLCLAAVWLFVLDQKIRHGPEPYDEPDRTGGRELIAIATRRAGRDGSMTGGES